MLLYFIGTYEEARAKSHEAEATSNLSSDAGDGKRLIRPVLRLSEESPSVPVKRRKILTKKIDNGDNFGFKLLQCFLSDLGYKQLYTLSFGICRTSIFSIQNYF